MLSTFRIFLYKQKISFSKLYLSILDYFDSLRLKKREANPFITHIPILIGLAANKKIERVLEFGCGKYSTLLFLNTDAFPDLVQLDSYENDPAWINEIRHLINEDPRATLSLISGQMSDQIEQLDLSHYDLIFIDDSHSPKQRTRTIHAVQACRGEIQGVVIIHDYENGRYRRATSNFKHSFRFSGLNPNTGLLWEKDNLKFDPLAIDQIIKKYSQAIQPSDVHQWISLLRQPTT